MRTQGNFGRLIVVGLMAFALAGCASSYDRKANNTMMGAGLGAAAGAGPTLTAAGAGAITAITAIGIERRPRNMGAQRLMRRA